MNLLKTFLKKRRDRQEFKSAFDSFSRIASGNGRFCVNWEDRKQCSHDNTPSTGFDAHCIYHPAWAARVLAKTQPNLHVDISSAIEFCSVVSAFIPTKFYDFRPPKIHLDNLSSEHTDLLSLQFDDNSIDSLSCMHVVEHIGLGRYGDTLDPDGDLKAIGELTRVLALDGNLLFVTPIGRPKIMFNAHRIYSYRQIMEYFKNLELVEFSLVPDSAENTGLISGATEAQADAQQYGCGCFWFRKSL